MLTIWSLVPLSFLNPSWTSGNSRFTYCWSLAWRILSISFFFFKCHNLGLLQPRCLSADEWIRRLWYIYTMEYYSAIKKNTFESVLMRWMKLELIIQSEVSQKEKHQYSILKHIYIYIEFIKTVTITLYARHQKKHRCIEQTFGLCGRGRVWDDLGEWDWNMYNIM